MRYYLSLGSNIGDREQTLLAALTMIEQQIGSVPRRSSFFYSAPWGFDSPNEFCNLCCLVQTDLDPMAMLRATQSIEQALGRTRKSIDGIYHDRPIDIDLIRAFDEENKEVKLQIMNPESPTSNLQLLTLPHPLWQERDFVRIPLLEIML
jgi:2-amino-4-hydroxy-6-hydroxymethyldihydropteridine diphosphokinase